MKNGIIIYLTLLTLISSIVDSAAQKYGSLDASLEDFFYTVKILKSIDASEEVKYTGSPYLHDEFQQAILVTTDSIIYSGIPLRYNMHNGIFEFKKDNVAYEIASSVPIKEIRIKDKVFQKMAHELGKKTHVSFFQKLYAGKISLYAKHGVHYIEAKKPKPYQEAKSAEFKKKPVEYYILFENTKKLVHLPKKKSQLIAFFSDKSNEIENFIKKNKLKTNKEKDILKIVKYYSYLR